MNYKESELQRKCVRWFRRNYPEYQNLFFHVRNENSEGAQAGGRAVAEGVQAGVADLMLLIPSGKYNGFAIEMKAKRGQQKPMQEWFQKFYEAQGGKYMICKDETTFYEEVSAYLDEVDPEFAKLARQMQVKMEQEMELARVEEEKRKAQNRLKEILTPEEKERKKEERKAERQLKEREKARRNLAKLISRVGQ